MHARILSLTQKHCEWKEVQNKFFSLDHSSAVEMFLSLFCLYNHSYVPFHLSYLYFFFVFSVSLLHLKCSPSSFVFLNIYISHIASFTIPPIRLLPRFESIDFLPACLSLLSVGLRVVPACLPVCPPASLHLTVCLSSVFICLLFSIFIQLFVSLHRE